MLVELEIRSVRDRVLVLRSLPTFAELDDASLIPLAEGSRVRRVRRGELLLRAADVPTAVFVIISGGVRMTRERFTLHATRSHGAVGLLPLLAGAPMGVDAIAEEDTSMVEIPAETLFDSMSADFAVVRHILKNLAQIALRQRDGLPADLHDLPSTDVGTFRATERTLVERLLRIRQSPVGKIANLDTVAELARSLRERRFQQGETLFKAGDDANGWFLIAYGRIRCETPEGRGVTLGSDYQFGTFDCLAGSRRGYTAVAETPVITEFANFSDQLTILEVNTSLAMAMASMMSKLMLARVIARAHIDDHEGPGWF
jgi:CRP-like cAMP-binding protein